MKPLKVIIIDDEPRARVLLTGMLNTYCPSVDVVAEAEDLPSGVKQIVKHRPDIVFLDIEMPGHSGLEILDFFQEKEVTFSIVFTTAYHHFAIKAFKLSALDYLLKPIDPEELESAVNRASSRVNFSHTQIVHFQATSSGNENDSIVIPTSTGMRFIPKAQIVFISADNTYSEIRMSSGETVVASRTLKNFEDVFKEDPTFLRCHKSYIINTKSILEIVKSDGGFLIMSDKTEIPITAERAKELLSRSQMVRR